MAITQTSYLPSAMREGLFDELIKIGEEAPATLQSAVKPTPDSKTKFKRWAKMALVGAAGTGAGTAAYMTADKYLFPHIAKLTKDLSPNTKKLLLSGGISATTMISALAAKAYADRHKKEMDRA